MEQYITFDRIHKGSPRSRVRALVGELDEKKMELIKYSYIISCRNDFLLHLRMAMKTLAESNTLNRQKINDIINEIDRELFTALNSNEQDKFLRWNDQEFKEKLLIFQPCLSKSEIRICELMKLRLNCKEIAKALSLSQRTVESHRLRIRKKFQLSTHENLDNFILQL